LKSPLCLSPSLPKSKGLCIIEDFVKSVQKELIPYYGKVKKNMPVYNTNSIQS
jgi:hypothetical protein